MMDHLNCLVESMCRHIGQTVTIFTTSGGLSGNGFTGVLLTADCNCVRLLAEVGNEKNYTAETKRNQGFCGFIYF